MGNTATALTEAVYYILLSLVEPRHGYAIMQHVEAMSRGRLRISAGTMYGALSGLIDKGWIEPLEGDGESRKKEYRITPSGRDALAGELDRLRELVANGSAVLGDGSDAGRMERSDENL